MKKNGCEIVFSCAPGECKYFDGDYFCTYVTCSGGCRNKAAQREAMKPKTRWTSKPAKKEGWYWIKTYNCTIYPAHTSETIIIGYRGNTVNFAIEQGSKRSVKPIEED